MRRRYRLTSSVIVIVVAAAIAVDRLQSQQRVDIDQALLDKVANGGFARVIVGVQSPFVPEGDLRESAAIVSQRAAIQREVEAVTSRAATAGVPVRRAFSTIPYFTARVNQAQLTQLASLPGVVSIVEDVPLQPNLLESIPRIRADVTHAAGVTGSGWSVAILDTGVDRTHPFFAGKVVAEACFSNHYGDGVSVCPGGGNTQIGIGSGVHCSGVAGCTHGTHVAGIAAGAANQPDGRSGVAPGAGIIAIQVFTRYNDAADCSGGFPCISTYAADYISGLEYVLSLAGDNNVNRVASANMSLGSGSHQAFCDSHPSGVTPAIQNLASIGIPTVIATGNDEYFDAVSFPSCISTAISVGATDDGDFVTGFTNRRAGLVDLMAPGEAIISSIPGGFFASDRGTSMAAPHVAGAWALLKQANPAADVNKVLTALQASGASIFDQFSGGSYRRIDVEAARLLLIEPPPAPFSKLTPVDGAVGQYGDPLLTWQESARVLDHPGYGYEACVDTINNNVCDTAWMPTGDDPEQLLEALAPNTTYYWQARARNLNGVTEADGGIWRTFATTSFPNLSLSGVSLTEGNSGTKQFAFTANLSAPIDHPVKVHYQTVEGTANSTPAPFGSFANATPIAIPDSNAATPYPSSVPVYGVPGAIGRVTVTLSNLSHSIPSSLDILLVGPTGQSVVLMSDAGSISTPIGGVTLVFADGAPPLPIGLTESIVSGTYRPTDYFGHADTYPSPAPPGPHTNTLLNPFAGTDPNGNWQLFVTTAGFGTGSIAGGWSLSIETIDYVAATGVLVIPSNTLSQQFAITVRGDFQLEPDENFFVNLSQASTAVIVGAQATGTILNDDVAPPTVRVNDVSTNEGSSGIGAIPFTASLSAPAGYPIAVGYQTSDGTAVAAGGVAGPFANSTPIAIPAPGAITPYPSSITVLGLPSLVKKVNVTLSNVSHTSLWDLDILLVGPTGRTLVLMSNAGVLSAVNNATFVFDDAGPAVPFSGAVGSGTYRPTNWSASPPTFPPPAPPGAHTNTTLAATFNSFNPNGVWQLFVVDSSPGSNGGAIAGGWSLSFETHGDYAPRNDLLVIPANTVSAIFGITVFPDYMPEPNETMTVDLYSPMGATLGDAHGVGTILNDDAATPTIGIGDVTLSEGNSGSKSFTFTASLSSAVPYAVAVNYQTAAGTANSATAPAGPFVNSTAISVPTIGVGAPYPSAITVSGLASAPERVRVTLSNVSHELSSDLDILLVGPTGQKVMLMSDVGFGAISGATLVFDDDAAPLPGSGAVAGGTYRPTNFDTTDTFSSPAPAPPYTNTQLSTFAGLDPNGTWQLFVFDDGAPRTGAIAGGWSLAFDSRGDYVPANGLVVFPPASTSQLISIMVHGDHVFEADEDFAVNLSGAMAATIADAQGLGVITNDDQPMPAFSIGDVALAEGNAGATTFSFTASLSNPAGYPITVDYSTSDGTATSAGGEIVPAGPFVNAGSISIPAVGSATPYPSSINVSGIPGAIARVTVTLNGYSRTAFQDEVDVLLVGPTGQSLILMSDVGSSAPLSGVSMVFDDAGALLTSAQIVSGTYRPTNVNQFGVADTFASPAPVGPHNATALSAFNGLTPNGTWSLYVVDDFPGNSGSIANGWSLSFEIAKGDYAASAGSLLFPPGVVSLPIDIPVGGDITIEPHETFVVNLANVLGATIADGSGQATILDDDGISPTVTGVVPAAGSIAGGTAVTISGNAFASGATVTFGGVPATTVIVVNATTITAVTPAHAVGAVSVVVVNPDLRFGTLPAGFTYGLVPAKTTRVRVTPGGPGP